MEASDLAPAARLRGVGPLLVVLAGTALRAVAAGAVPLTPDEAYYALWTRHLQPGYLDHPPAVAWLGAAGLGLLGRSELGLRAPALLCQAVAALLAASLAGARGGPRAALAAALLLQAVPAFSLGGALLTPDAPLALAWVAALWAFDRALRLHPAWLVAAGVALGLGVLSKLTAGLLGVALLAALLSTRDGRRLLATPWPWLGAAAALAVASPFLAWNAARGWPSLGFQARHGLGGDGFSALRLAGSLGAQAAYVSPVVLLAAAAAAWRARADPDLLRRALACSALPVVGFFTVAAAWKPGSLPHWPAPGWLSACLLLAIAGGPWLRGAIQSGLALVLAAPLVLALPLPARLDPLAEVRGWREVTALARAAAGEAPLVAGHWIALGQLAWYDGREVAYAGGRPCATSLWDDALPARGPGLAVVVDRLGAGRDELAGRLGPLVPAGAASVERRGEVVRGASFYRVGAAPPVPAR